MSTNRWLTVMLSAYVSVLALPVIFSGNPPEDRQPVFAEQVASVEEMPTYIIDASPAVLNDGPFGESFTVSLRTPKKRNAKKEALGYFSLDLRVKNTGKVTIDAPYFTLYNAGEFCGEAVLSVHGDLWNVRPGKSIGDNLLFGCPNAIKDLTNLQVVATYRDSEMQWVYEE